MRIFLFKFCYLQQGLLMEGAIFWGVGIEGFVGQCLFQWAPLSKEVLGAWIPQPVERGAAYRQHRSDSREARPSRFHKLGNRTWSPPEKQQE